MKLTRLNIRNFKSIKKLDLDLKPINILIGANGSGKSNLISFFALLNNLINKNLQNYVKEQGGADRLLYYGRKTSTSLEFKINFGKHYYFSNLKSSSQDTLYFEKELLGYGDGNKNDEIQDLGFGHLETKIYEVINKKNYKNYRKLSGHLADFLEEIKVFHLNDSSAESNLRKSSNIEDYSSLRSDGSNLASFLYNLSSNSNRNYFNLIESTIRLFFPIFQKFQFKPAGKYINLEWKEKFSTKYFNGFDFSDGTIRMIFFTTLLLQPEPPKFIIIDEPELGLHPYSMSLFVSLIRKASLKSSIIIATQSSEFVDFFKPKDIIVVDRNSNTMLEENNNYIQSTFQRLDTKNLSNWLKNYTVAELWKKNIIGARPT